MRPLVVQLLRTPAEKRDAKVLEESGRAAAAAATLLDRELSKRPYVAGDHFTFGDIPVASASQRWLNLPIERPRLPTLEGWYARVKERAGFKRWLDIPLA